MIGLFGVYGDYNLGDAFLMETALELLSKWNLINQTIVFLQSEDKYVRAVLKKFNVKKSYSWQTFLNGENESNFQIINNILTNKTNSIKQRQFLKNLNKISIAWFAGGGYLNSQWKNSSLIPVKFLTDFFKLKNIKYIFTHQTYGPFFTNYDSTFFENIIEKSEYCSQRDNGINRIKKVPDLACSYKCKNQIIFHKIKQKYVACFFHGWTGHNIDNDAQVFSKLIFKFSILYPKLNFILFITNELNGDEKLNYKISDITGYPFINIKTSEDYFSFIKESSFIISTRFHPIIIANLLLKKTISIYYDDYYKQKLIGALNTFENSNNSLFAFDRITELFKKPNMSYNIFNRFSFFSFFRLQIVLLKSKFEENKIKFIIFNNNDN